MHDHAHSHDAGCGCDGGHDGHNHAPPEVLLRWMFSGAALLLAGWLARSFYPENILVSDFAAALGALVLSIPIFKDAIHDLISGHVHMNELVALAILAAMINMEYFTVGIIAFFMVLATFIETRTASGAHEAIEQLVRLNPTDAVRLTAAGDEETVEAAALVPGDRIRLRPGDQVPADGQIVEGRTALNEASVTGESLPRDKVVGDDVFAGTQNLTGSVVLEVTRIGEDTTLGKVRDLILQAERSRLPLTKIVDKYAGFYTPVVLMLAWVVWFFTNDWERVIALLIISCPCAFVLATPTAMVAALSAAARNGLLIKNVVELEAASRIDAVVFDKTGTLTTGNLGVERLNPVDGIGGAELLTPAVAVERLSNHPAAQAVCRLGEEAQVPVLEASDFHEEPGLGVRGVVDGKTVLAGRSAWLREQGISGEAFEAQAADDAEGLSTIFIAEDGKFLGWVGLRDQLRPAAKETLIALRELQVKHIAMVTGDRQAVADRVAGELGGMTVQAECLPEEKASYVEGIKSEGYRVAFVGDGVNDAPALAASNTGIAMGAAGSDVAIHSAEVALMSNDLTRLPELVKLSRQSRSIIYQNLAAGGLFVVLGLALSAFGKLPPIPAAILHNAGSLIIVFNSARLIRSGQEDK